MQPTPNTPLLEAKKDLRANLQADLGNTLSGFNGTQFQVAYSPFSKIGLQINGHWNQRSGSTTIRNWDENDFEMYHIEGALGYYRTIKQHYFSIYGGYGLGVFNEVNSYSESIFGRTRITKASFGEYDKFFFQCALLVQNGSMVRFWNSL